MELLSPLLPATTFVWQPRQGRWALTVVCKATLLVLPGEAKLAPQQDPLTLGDQRWEDDPKRSLVASSDRVPAKRRVDVLVTGSAFAPEGQRSRYVIARLLVERVDKSIGVFLDRTVAPDGTVQEGRGFARMPLVYERAAGGPTTWNPVGLRPDQRTADGHVTLPNLTIPGPGASAANPVELREPTGFGPLAPEWPSRRGMSPVDAERTPLPEGFDFAAFNVAPSDQQLDELPARTRIRLEHLHAEHARLETMLPEMAARATLERPGGTPVTIPLRADTLAFDTDRGTCTVVWRGHTPLEHAGEAGRVRITFDVDPTAWAEGETAPLAVTSARSPREDLAKAAMAGATRTSPTGSFDLPFQRQDGSPRAAEASTPAAGAVRPFAPLSAPPLAAPPLVAPPLASPPLASPPLAAPPLAPPPAPRAAAPSFAPPPVSVTHAAPVSVPTPPRVVPQHAAGAALAGLASASNAASDAGPSGPAARSRPKRTTDGVDLLWFDGDLPPQVRRVPVWRKLLRRLDEAPPDRDADEPAAGGADLEDRREVFEVLARGNTAPEGGVDDALQEGFREGGRFAAQLVLVAGELRMGLDPLAELKATTAAARPHEKRTEPLTEAVDAALRYLATPALVSPPEVARELTASVHAAFAAWAQRPHPPEHLADVVERTLVERRDYDEALVLGRPHLRAQFFFEGSTTGVPAYLPKEVASKLPLDRQFPVRLLAEVHPPTQRGGVVQAALRVVAVARRIAPPG